MESAEVGVGAAADSLAAADLAGRSPTTRRTRTETLRDCSFFCKRPGNPSTYSVAD